MDTEMTTPTTAPAMVTVIIEPENLSCMMASFACGAVLQSFSKPRSRMVALFEMAQQARREMVYAEPEQTHDSLLGLAESQGKVTETSTSDARFSGTPRTTPRRAAFGPT
jgi:hypothetical protein